MRTKEELEEILEKHAHWLQEDKDGIRANLRYANLRGADLKDTDLRYANLKGANLSEADLREANLNGANLRGANLKDTNLSEADLREANLNGANLRGANLNEADLNGANLRGADLRYANLRGANLNEADLNEAKLSGCKGLLSPISYMEKNFEKTKEGYICYKTFNSTYTTPEYWKVEKGSVITKVVNPCRTTDCACGINVGTLQWVNDNSSDDAKIWKCLIKWEWLAGVVVPYHTDGKIRCEKAQLLEVI